MNEATGNRYLARQYANNPFGLPTPDTCLLDANSLTRLGAFADEGRHFKTSMLADAGRVTCVQLLMCDLARRVFIQGDN
jgi:hypothetical protein